MAFTSCHHLPTAVTRACSTSQMAEESCGSGGMIGAKNPAKSNHLHCCDLGTLVEPVGSDSQLSSDSPITQHSSSTDCATALAFCRAKTE